MYNNPEYNIGDLIWVHIISPFRENILCRIDHIIVGQEYPYVCHPIDKTNTVYYANEDWMSPYIYRSCPEYFYEI